MRDQRSSRKVKKVAFSNLPEQSSRSIVYDALRKVGPYVENINQDLLQQPPHDMRSICTQISMHFLEFFV